MPFDQNALDLIDRCKLATGREYPAGYGHALIYLDEAESAYSQLFNAACDCVCFAFAEKQRCSGFAGGDDVARFAQAVAWGEGWRGSIVRYYHLASDSFITPARNFDPRREGLERVEFPKFCAWLIEAAQLVLQFALTDDAPRALRTKCAEALKAAGHPGY